jgi:predicted alternative tryptophan synthase beta-subunit
MILRSEMQLLEQKISRTRHFLIGGMITKVLSIAGRPWPLSRVENTLFSFLNECAGVSVVVHY